MSRAYDDLLDKARAAEIGGESAWSPLSTRDKLAVALVLNRPDWISSLGYTLGEAIGHLEVDSLAAVPDVERAVRGDRQTFVPDIESA